VPNTLKQVGFALTQLVEALLEQVVAVKQLFLNIENPFVFNIKTHLH
jgi:hypothetical protein